MQDLTIKVITMYSIRFFTKEWDNVLLFDLSKDVDCKFLTPTFGKIF
jgi:hypothetical protein